MSSSPVPAANLNPGLPSDPAAIDSAVASQSIAEDSAPHRWSSATRIAFRFAFCYFTLFCLCGGNATIWDSIPVIGEKIEYGFAAIFLYPAQYLAGHLFHIPPPGNQLHPTGSGDTAINWICALLLLAASALATIVWSVLDRKRPHYQTLAAWLRFLIRLTLGFGMVTYGLAKVFPLQMPPPSIGSLSEPLGMHSPMSLLWNFIGVNPIYEMVCGGAELLAGMLILFRRTALAGALLTAFVVTNVLLYNLFFDVPVKLYAGHLLLLSLFVILPDASALFRFFWLHQPAAPSGVWVPPASRVAFRRATVAVEIAFAAFAVGGTCLGAYYALAQRHLEASAPCPLCGDWHIDSANLVDPIGKSVATPPRTKKGYPATDLIIDGPAQASYRDISGDRLYLKYTPDRKAQTLELAVPGRPGTLYAFQSNDPTHMVLTPLGGAIKTSAQLQLTLLTPTGGYPLVTRGFHWISEYPYQR